MNIEKITYNVVKQHIMHSEVNSAEFIMKMMISYLTDEERGAVMDEIVNERDHVEFKKGTWISFDSSGNKYDGLEDIIEEDRMKDAKLMDQNGFLKAKIIDDKSYSDECNPFAVQYKVEMPYMNPDHEIAKKELYVKRSFIVGLWKDSV
tara:strand:+ start:77 stop:523 length:447 start_codon:yes stop_codon:yes gene_type:complete